MENIPAGYQLILCISLTDLYVFHGRHLAVDVFPAGSHTFQLSCHRWIQLPAASDGGSVQL